jgi:hypothetical protein
MALDTADTALDAVVREIIEQQTAVTPIATALRAALRRSQMVDTRRRLHEELAIVERRLRLLATARAAVRALLHDGFPDPVPNPLTSGRFIP